MPAPEQSELRKQARNELARVMAKGKLAQVTKLTNFSSMYLMNVVSGNMVPSDKACEVIMSACKRI